MIVIEEGAEYRGERYIYCSVHTSRDAMFEGRTLEELEAFIAQHRDCQP